MLLQNQERLGLWTLILLSALCCGLMLNPFLTVVNHDSAIFCLLGQSLAQGKGYLLLSETSPSPYFTFPPLLALQIAGIMKLLGTTDPQAIQSMLKAHIHGLFLLSLPVFYAFIRPKFSTGKALGLTALLAFSSLVFKYSADILSDVPYWTYSLLALVCLSRWAEIQQDKTSAPGSKVSGIAIKWSWLLIALGFVALSCWMRQMGMALALSTGLFIAIECLRHRVSLKTLLIVSVVLALVVGAWPAYEHQYRSTHTVHEDTLNQADVSQVLEKSPVKIEYIKHFLVDKPVSQDQSGFQTSPQRLVANIAERFIRYQQLILQEIFPPLKVKLWGVKQNLFTQWPFVLTLSLLLLLGLKAFWQTFRAVALYVLVYAAVLLVYPYISPRFLVPVYPFVMLWLVLGLETLSQCFGFSEGGLSPRPPSENICSAPGVPTQTHSAANIFTVARGPRFPARNSYTSPRSNKWVGTNPLETFLIFSFLLLALLGGQLPETIRFVRAGYQLKMANQGPSLRPENRAFYQSILWLKTHTPPHSLIISRKPPVTYYYAQRQASAFLFTAQPERLRQHILSKHQQHPERPLYILQDTAFGESEKYLSPALSIWKKQYPQELEPVYQDTQGNRIWRLNTNT